MIRVVCHIIRDNTHYSPRADVLNTAGVAAIAWASHLLLVHVYPHAMQIYVLTKFFKSSANISLLKSRVNLRVHQVLVIDRRRGGGGN